MLAKAATIAGLGWDNASAHSATYDAERTAELFCTVCNELAGSFRRAEYRARDLGWHDHAVSADEAADAEIDEGAPVSPGEG